MAQIFKWLYKKTIALARGRYATSALGGVAFTESFIFPIPPDVLLLPMMLAKSSKDENRNQIWNLALWATLCSGAGALFGYYLGATAWETLAPFIGGAAAYGEFKSAYGVYGVWVVLIAAISFIPFKLATLASGALGAPLLPFIFAAFLGRGIRFFILAALVYFFGHAIIANIDRYSARLSWAILALAAISAYIIWGY